MGFIERLKQEKGKLRQEEERKRLEATRPRVSLWEKVFGGKENKTIYITKEEARRQLEKAKAYYHSSAFLGLIQELRDIEKDYPWSESKIHYSEWERIEDGYYNPVSSRESDEYKNYICIDVWWWKPGLLHTICISFFSSGVIKVEGGRFGSSMLPLNQWEGRSEVQEEALEKAYRHPKTIEVDESYKSPYTGPTSGN